MPPSPEDVTARLTALVGPAVAGLAPEQQPAVVALAERIAAGRYRAWAERVEGDGARATLRACADREEEIAARVEATVAGAEAVQRDVESRHPGLRDGYAALFDGLDLRGQLAFQAEAERTGAATWRNLAAAAPEEIARVYLACAELEEESADAVERLLAAGAAA